ncbi:MAG: cofactor-independent phosphoglycerate mutase [Clostridiales bacterium]|jgi:2,3-bisphosphoglycerate-independent phosphoglycerate mutase|nr:cofactor-independent phosphoglycerate mutase [Clostridiales bacterium]
MREIKKIKMIILGDGMSDFAYEIDGDGKKQATETPLTEARTPVMDALAPRSRIGLVKTVPDGMKPGSDIANLSVMGYAPQKYYTGRSPLEAVSIGINMKDGDIALRCNLVTLSDEPDFGEKRMEDYGAGEIETDKAHILIEDFSRHLAQNGFLRLGDFLKNDSEKCRKSENTDPRFFGECFTFYGGVSYRNCLIVSGGRNGTEYTPPHDISGKKIGAHFPRGLYGRIFKLITEESYKFLSAHGINAKRIERGLNPANSVWLWGEGKKPSLDDFYKLTGRRGAVISAVDLIKGIGIAAKMRVYKVDGATGTVHTNFAGKADAALKAADEGCDFVYLHIEAADESGHHGNRAEKILSIEKIDWVIEQVKDGLDKRNTAYTLMILPDHPTPVATRTHSADPVPYMIYDSEKNLANGIEKYCERTAEQGEFAASGTELLRMFLSI